jgi:hypothetical protein
MCKINKKKVKLLTALFFLTFTFTFGTLAEPSFGATKQDKKPKKPSKTQKPSKSDGKKQESASSDYLPESDLAKDYIPEIYRCPECGYEQDSPGLCPDHSLIQLALIVDRTKNPLAPTEYDGNEDILVDIPLKNLVFKKEQLSDEATDSEDTANDKAKEKEDKK